MHIGQIIRQKVAENGMSVVAFARELSCTRGNAYKLFDKRSIDTETLLRISVILGYDFFQHYSECLKNGIHKG